MSSNFKKIMLSTALVVSFQSMAFAASPDHCGGTATGSYGSFAPSAFLGNAERPWNIFRASGTYTKRQDCGMQGLDCLREKKYSIVKVDPQPGKKKCIQVGVGSSILDVERMTQGPTKKVKLINPGGGNYLVMDGFGATSRLGADGTATMTLSRVLGTQKFASVDKVGAVLYKQAPNSTIRPYSFYYSTPGTLTQDEPELNFGLSVVEKLQPLGVAMNFISKTPMKERMRTGTYWCYADDWKPENGLLGLVKDEDFDMNKCHGNKLLSSDSKATIGNQVANLFLNRMNSIVELYNPQYTYEIKAETDWFCPFDCDGTTYTIERKGSGKPFVKINSNKWNWLSSTGFKVKTVFVDWDGDGFAYDDKDVDLRDLAENPAAYKDIVAIIISEYNSLSASSTFSQNSFIMFPPTVRGGDIPGNYLRIDDKLKEKIAQNKVFTKAARMHRSFGTLMYNMKLLDSILAMMPDQTQTSPELADIEEKLDELRLVASINYHFDGVNQQLTEKAFSTDLAFDVYSEVDATTAVKWKEHFTEGQEKELNLGRINRDGKIEWFLKEIGELRQ